MTIQTKRSGPGRPAKLGGYTDGARAELRFHIPAAMKIRLAHAAVDRGLSVNGLILAVLNERYAS